MCPDTQAWHSESLPNATNIEFQLQASLWLGVRAEEQDTEIKAAQSLPCRNTCQWSRSHLSWWPEASLPFSPALRPGHHQTVHLGLLLWLQFWLRHRPPGYLLAPATVSLGHDLDGHCPAHRAEVTI